ADPNAVDSEYGATPIRYQIAHHDIGHVLAARGASVDIFAAAGLDDATRVAKILNAQPELIDARTRVGDVLGPGNTPLRLAAALGSVNVAKLLLDRGADIHARGGIANATPLHAAAWYGNPDVAQILLDRGAQIEARDDRGSQATPLAWAAMNARKDMVEFLLDHGAGLSRDVIEGAEAGAAGT